MLERTIMIADDDIALARLLNHSLKQLGVRIHEVHDAMHALTLIHRSPPDLVIMDVLMPAGNGLSVCEMLASDTRLRRIPVIILTGDSRDATLARCQEMGAHYLHKGPNVLNDIRRLVCKLLPTLRPALASASSR